MQGFWEFFLNPHRPDSLVDDDPDGVFGDIEYAPGAAVITFVGHSLLEGSISFYVDDISSLVDPIERRKGLQTVPFELPREHVPRPATDTRSVHHFCSISLIFTLSLSLNQKTS